MPRYFFHLSFGQRVVPDEDGFELPNRPAACAEALAIVRDLTNPEHSGGSRRWASWFLEVADAGGSFFRTPIGHPALEIVTPETPGAAAQVAVQPIGPGAQEPALKKRAAEIIRERLARQQRTAQLLQDNIALRQELSELFLATKRIRTRANRLVSRARAAGER